jgi:DNA-binding NarL/FixJ family response regulator
VDAITGAPIMPIKTFIADEHALLREGLRALLSQNPDVAVVGEAPNGKLALSEALLLKPDIVLMNIALPGMNGMEVTAHLKRRLPQVRVIMLTSFKSEEYLRESLRVGADGYLLKDSTYEELALAMRNVAQGRKYLSPALSGQLVDGFLNPVHSSLNPSPLHRLTSRERSVLQLIAEGRTNRSAAEFLSVSPKTIEKHRARLMQKLGLRNASELLLAAVDMGMIERPGALSRLVDRSYA